MGDAHRYIPASEEDRRAMLREIGRQSIDDLFATIPANLRVHGDMEIPGPLSEMELLTDLKTMAAGNRPIEAGDQFLGGGAYRHYIPSVVDHLIGRTEFYSSYTPYQPEISQGTLQSIFEYQTLICQLT